MGVPTVVNKNNIKLVDIGSHEYGPHTHKAYRTLLRD